MCECLWSDPAPEPGRQASKRGVGLQFGPDITKKFLQDNGLELVVRSHEVSRTSQTGPFPSPRLALWPVHLTGATFFLSYYIYFVDGRTFPACAHSLGL